jgi:hypothetical protein
MTATEQWIFLCAAHKNPKEVNRYLSIKFIIKKISLVSSY